MSEKSPEEYQKKARSELLSKLRKQRSAQAAKERRSNENHEYEKIKKLLPIDEVTANNLDKASAIRITISFLRLCKFAGTGTKDWNLHFAEPPHDPLIIRQQLTRSTLQTLDGFLMLISTDCKILYISETINEHLGLNWTEFPGSAVTELIPHAEDHQELKSLLRGLHNLGPNKEEQSSDYVNMVLRFKSQKEKRNTNTTKGKIGIPTKACHVVGYLRYSDQENARGFVCSVFPLMTTSVRDMILPPNSFFVLTDDKFVVTKVDRSVSSYIELEQEDMIDVSIYSMIHPADVDTLIDAHNQFLTKSQGTTRYYRWLQRNNGYVWCKSTLSLVHKKDQERVLWVNQIISVTPADPYNGIDLFQRFPADFKTSKSSTQALDSFIMEPSQQTELYDPTGDTKTETCRTDSDGSPSKVYPKEYSPGSSPERQDAFLLEPASPVDESGHQPMSTTAVLTPADDIERNIATYNRPPNSDIASIMSQSKSQGGIGQSGSQLVQLPKKTRHPSEPFKRPVVIMQPPALRNDPIGTKHHFKDPGDTPPNEKYRKTDEGLPKPRPKFKQPRPRETLKSSLDERNPANQTFEGNERGAMKFSPQKVRLPQAKQPRPDQFNIVHQDAQLLNPVFLHNGQEYSYQSQETMVPVSSLPLYHPATATPVQQRSNDKVVYYVPCHREQDEGNKPKYVHVPELPVLINKNGRLEPENEQQQLSPPAPQAAPAVQHVMYLATGSSSTQPGYIQAHAPSPFIGIPFIPHQNPQHAQPSPIVLVPQPNGHHGQLQLIGQQLSTQ